MKERLIHFLNGVTQEEYSLLRTEYQNQRDLAIILRRSEDELHKLLGEEKAERLKLQEIIFRRFGVVFNEEAQTEQEEFKPISSGTQRITNIMRAMEQDDRKRVKENGKAQTL
jgi:hypothetical protein